MPADSTVATRRDHGYAIFQALKRLAKLNRRYAAVSQALKRLAKLKRRYAAQSQRFSDEADAAPPAAFLMYLSYHAR